MRSAKRVISAFHRHRITPRPRTRTTSRRRNTVSRGQKSAGRSIRIRELTGRVHKPFSQKILRNQRSDQPRRISPNRNNSSGCRSRGQRHGRIELDAARLDQCPHTGIPRRRTGAIDRMIAHRHARRRYFRRGRASQMGDATLPRNIHTGEFIGNSPCYGRPDTRQHQAKQGQHRR